jgi:hypothetical protein
VIRRGLFLLAATTLAVAVTGSAGATYSLLDFQSAVAALETVDPTIEPPPNDSSKDFAVGGFRGVGSNNDGFANNVGFSAHSGSLGENPNGHLSETEPHAFPPMSSSTYQGRFRVTCLAVLGNEAALGLVPTETASNDQPQEFVFAVRDSGLPNGAGDQYAFVPGVPAELCEFGLGEAEFPIESGNILVHDAIPIP